MPVSVLRPVTGTLFKVGAFKHFFIRTTCFGDTSYIQFIYSHIQNKFLHWGEKTQRETRNVETEMRWAQMSEHDSQSRRAFKSKYRYINRKKLMVQYVNHDGKWKPEKSEHSAQQSVSLDKQRLKINLGECTQGISCFSTSTPYWSRFVGWWEKFADIESRQNMPP